MSDQTRLSELLLDWEQRRRLGRPAEPEQLCAGCPELAAPLRERVRLLLSMEGFLGAADTAREGGAETPPPEPALDLLPRGPGEGGRLGPFRVLGVLGQGGMGQVLRAHDPSLEREVAVKVMHPHLAARPEARARFLREARAVAAVSHPHVVPIHHVGEEKGLALFVMPLLAGESLAARLARRGRLPVAELLRVGREAAEGLAAAHARGVIHRDVKPGNLWLEALASPGAAARERTVLLDFGLAWRGGEAALTEPGALVGTPAYMAPEQVCGQAPGERGDLFSLGVVLYEMAAGEPPFRGDDLLAVLHAAATAEPPPLAEVRPDLPSGLAALIAGLLCKRPEGRPASAREVAEALRALEATAPEAPATLLVTPPPLRPAEAPAPAVRPGRRRALVLGALGLAAGVALVALAGWALRKPAGVGPAGGGAAGGGEVPGQVDVLFWSKKDKTRWGLGLHDPEALPGHPTDRIRVEARAEAPAYLYLFWVDADADAQPIYPWKPGRWGTRPDRERPVRRVSLPEKEDDGVPLGGDKDGMETLVLLACQEPLKADDGELKRLLGGLAPQRSFPHARTAVWFADGEVVRDDPLRMPAFFAPEKLDDPLRQLHRQLRERLGPLGGSVRGVSFARVGE